LLFFGVPVSRNAGAAAAVEVAFCDSGVDGRVGVMPEGGEASLVGDRGSGRRKW